ncbi:hypothetical protein P4519_15025, partial [Geobacillus stearothermophilus]|uniref:hypothetical protein n=2 Tax=Geobacillus stearothermophilus TaxID=1422 RepID=UPI002E21444D|nr:hypothetical protein [Geobacillus stearothermophilus]
KFLHQIRECGMLVHREHLLGLFVSLLTFYRKGALFSIPFGFYWIINTPEMDQKIFSSKIGRWNFCGG